MQYDKINYVTSNSDRSSLFNIALEFQGEKKAQENCLNVNLAHFTGYRNSSCE